jgi:hypothetical protein
MKTADSLSGSRFERVEIAGEPFVLKYLHVDDDWIQRATGDVTCRPVVMWRSGLFDKAPDCLDHTIVDVAVGSGRNAWGAAVLMRDVTPWLVPEGNTTIPLSQHRTFLDHMARLHATFWGFRDAAGLAPMGNRFFVLSPLMASVERERGGTDPVPRLVPDGWRRIAHASPRAATVALPLLSEPAPLVEALETTPRTLIHADWKAGNLGTLPDGRTILLDWAFPGEGPAALDLTWYLAVNCDRLPESKEDTIGAYRACLEGYGIDTATWFETQLDLALVGAFVLLGWSKDGAELAWWEDHVPQAAARLR